MSWLGNPTVVTDNTVEILWVSYDKQRFYLQIITKQNNRKQTIILNKGEAEKIYPKLGNFIKED